MLDDYLPDYHFKTKHYKVIKAPVKIIYPQVRHLNFNSSLISRFLFILRGLTIDDLAMDKIVDKGSFFTLKEKINEEWVIGLVSNAFLLPVYLEEGQRFEDWNPKKGIKIAWNFRLEEIKDDVVKVLTETRVFCLSKNIRFWFSIYWFIIRPFSGIIRMEMLRIIKKKSEKRYSSMKPYYV